MCFAKFLFSLPVSFLFFMVYCGILSVLFFFFNAILLKLKVRGPFIMFSKENRFLLRTTFICTKIMGAWSMLQTMKIPRQILKTYLWTRDTLLALERCFQLWSLNKIARGSHTFSMISVRRLRDKNMGAGREEWVSEKKTYRLKAHFEAVGELWNAPNKMGISKSSNQKVCSSARIFAEL